MRRISVLICILMMPAILLACTAGRTEDASTVLTEAAAGTAEVSETTTEAEQPSEPETLFAGDFGTPEPLDVDIASGQFFNVDDLEEGLIETDDEGMVFLDAAVSSVLQIEGIEQPADNNDEYYRLNALEREKYSELNEALACNMAGVKVRFRTNADRIAVDMKVYAVPEDFRHFADRGVCGIDVYTGTGTDLHYCGEVAQHMTDLEELEEVIELPGGYQEVTIELPQYAGVSWFYIGFPEGSMIAEPFKRTNGPVLFYGSSITQGACTGRPGNAYTNILCRALDCECINLGFSGSDLGEQEIAQYITTRSFDVFVMDYNNNATVERLEFSHYAFYKTVRDAKPDIPIIILNRPYFTAEINDENLKREEIIRETYDRAVADGDENIYIISSRDYFPKESRELCTVDMVHPNDMGHYYMAKTIFPVLYEIISDIKK